VAVDERARHELHTRLEEAIGPEAAETLMELVPPVGWADVATKRDVDSVAVATKRDLDSLAATTKRDLDSLAATTKRDLDSVAAVLRSEMREMEARLTAHFEAGLHQQTRTLLRTMLATVIGSMGIMSGIGFGAAHLV
jgi:hypothetical protein